jgi:hypothetical protein
MVYISCPGSFSAEKLLQFQLESGERVAVNLDQLIVHYRGGSDMCKSRIRFAPRISHVIVGRVLTRSVARIVLNYRNSIIGFGLDDDLRGPFLDGEALIPVFSFPVVENNRITFPFSSNEGLVLFKTQPKIQVNSDNTQSTKWIFVRTKSLEEPLIDEYLAMNEFQDFEFRISASSGAEFLPTGHGSKSVYISTSPISVTVILKELLRRRRFDDLDLPRAILRIRPPKKEEEPCSICDEPFKEGDRVQRMQGCTHEFHLNCIKHLLEYGNASCPLCRTAVHYRPIRL